MKKHRPLIALCSLFLLAGCLRSPGSPQASHSPAASLSPNIATESPLDGSPNATITPSTSSSPTTKPSPSRLVFASNRGDSGTDKLDLFILDLESMTITPLHTGLDVLFPRWSPDGSRILFTDKGTWNLYIIEADGSHLTQVTNFRSSNGDWSPDGKRIVFQSDFQNEPVDKPDIYMIDVNGENLVEILDDPAILDFSPRWSPDGAQILYISEKNISLSVFRMKPDGSDPIQVTQSYTPVISAAWSPDGQSIVFAAQDSRWTSNLYIIGVDGGSTREFRLTNAPALDNGPCWSPDGEKIVFFSNRNGHYDLWVINADGTGLTPLTNDEAYDAYPDWAPR